MKAITDAGVIEIGTTEAKPTIGLTDYSRRETDDFGVTTVVKRGFSRTMSVRVMVPTANVDALQRQLAALRAKPVQWVADDRFDSLSINGFYKDLSIDLAIPPVSYCTLTIEGLAEGADYADPGTDPATDQRKSTLRLLRPASIDDAVLTSSNVPENDYPAWSASATYALGARVILSATHRIYESVANGNVGNDPTGAAGQWIDIAPTNRWAMFDQALGSQTERAGSIVVSLDPVDPIDAVALLDLTAVSVRVQAPGYDRTLSPANQPGAVTFLDLPATADAVTITISGSGTVSAGTLLIGKLLGLGTTEASPTAAITDYSRKETDAFGEVTVVERAWAKRMDVKSLISTAAVDVVAARIANVRAMPALWIGDATLESLAVYGFFKDFSIAVDEHVSTLSLSIEGLSTAAKLAPLGADVSWSDIKDDDPAHPKPEDGATVGATPEQVEQIADAQFTADAAAVAVAAAQAQIAAIEGAVSADLAAITAAVASLDGEIDGVRQAIEGLDASVTGSLATLNQAVGSLNDEVDIVRHSIDDLSASVTSDLATINQAVGSLNSDIVTVQDNIGLLEQQAAGIIASIGDVGVEVAQLTTDLTTANSNISLNAQAITSVSGSLAQLSSTVTAQGASISQNAQAIGALDSSLATLTTRVDAGSQNLFPWGNFPNGLQGWDQPAGWSTYGQSLRGNVAMVNATGGNFYLSSVNRAIQGGFNYTISVDIERTGTVGIVAARMIWTKDGAQLTGGQQFGPAAIKASGPFTNSFSGRVWASGLMPATANGYFVQLLSEGAPGDQQFRQIKVELGTSPSPWSDEASVTQVFQAYATLDTSFASLSSTVASQGGSITSLQQSYTGLNGTVSQLSSTVTAQGASIGSLQSASNSQAGQIAQLATDLATANSNISLNAQAITSVSGSLAQLSSTVTAQGASIGQNAQAIGALDSSLATLTTRVDAGSQNLFPWGNFPNGLQGWDQPAGWSTYGQSLRGNVAMVNATGGNFYLSSVNRAIQGGFNYTISVDIERTGTVGIVAARMIWTKDGAQLTGGQQFGPAAIKASGPFTNSFSGRVWASGLMPATANGYFVQLLSEGAPGDQQFRQIKVELGTSPSPWSDEASVTQVFQAYATLDTSFASLSSTVASQGGSITSLQQSYTGLNGTVSQLSSTVTAQGASIGSLQSASNSQAGQIAQLATDLATANSNISLNAQAITSVSGSLAQLSSTVTAQGASIGQNAQAIGALDSSLATLTTRVDAGSQNLFPWGNFPNGLQGWDQPAGWSTYGQSLRGNVAMVNATGGNFYLSSVNRAIQGGFNYTISVDIERTGTVGIVAARMIWTKDGAQLTGGQQFGPAAIKASGPFTNSFSGRVWASGLMPATANGYFVQLLSEGAPGDQQFRQIKVELGTSPSPWSDEASVTQVFQAYATLDTSFASLSSTVASQGGSITSLQQSYTGLNGTVSQLSSTVTAQGASIGSLQSASNSQAGQIAQLATDLATANSNISLNAQAITSVSGSLAQLSSTVTAQGASIGQNAQAIGALDSNLATLTMRANAGSQNLLKFGNFPNGFEGWSNFSSGWAATSNAVRGNYAVSQGSGNYYANSGGSSALPGWAYCISADVERGSSSGASGARIIWTSNGSDHSIGPVATKVSGGFGTTFGERVWQAAICPAGATGYYVQLFSENANGTGVRQIKVEIGNAPSPWSDEASVSQSFQALSTLNSQYASLSSTVATQGVSISTQATAITTIQNNVTTLFGQYVLDIDVNGRVAGMKLANNGSASSIIFRADLVRFEDPDPGTGAMEWKDQAIQMRDGAGKLRIFMGYRA